MFSGKNTIFADNARKIMFWRGPFSKDYLFRTFEENIIFPCIFFFFFEKDHLSFSVYRVRSYFREKEISSFPIIQERSYSRAIFLETPPFEDVWKKKIWFSVQGSSLCRKKICKGLNTLLYSNIHSSESYLGPS